MTLLSSDKQKVGALSTEHNTKKLTGSMISPPGCSPQSGRHRCCIATDDAAHYVTLGQTIKKIWVPKYHH
jgi:hypothetical protein